jgi:hypothetical protein
MSSRYTVRAEVTLLSESATLWECRMKNAGQKKLVPLPVRAARMLKRLKNVRGISDAEKSVHALGLAATPQERWDLWEKSMRSYGYWKPLKKKKSVT